MGFLPIAIAETSKSCWTSSLDSLRKSTRPMAIPRASRDGGIVKELAREPRRGEGRGPTAPTTRKATSTAVRPGATEIWAYHHALHAAARRPKSARPGLTLKSPRPREPEPRSAVAPAAAATTGAIVGAGAGGLGQWADPCPLTSRPPTPAPARGPSHCRICPSTRRAGHR